MSDHSRNAAVATDLTPQEAAVHAGPPEMPVLVDRDSFQAELDALRVREKAHTRAGDAIAAARRRLPMVAVDPGVSLIGPQGPVTLLEVDYPSASFGVGALASGAEYQYRFKIQGSGPVKLQFTDASGKTHTASGPVVTEGEQGTLLITISPADDVSWLPNLSKIR